MNKPHKHAQLIKAWADGAEIEWHDFSLGVWRLCKCPAWAEYIEYRIKSQPKLVPFTFEDAKDLIGKSVVAKFYYVPFKAGSVAFVTSVLNCSVKPVYLGNSWMSYHDLFNNFTFLDGSPCGKYVNE